MLVLLAETEEDQIVVKDFFPGLSLFFFSFLFFSSSKCVCFQLFSECKIEKFKT